RGVRGVHGFPTRRAADLQRAGGRDVGRRVGLGQVAGVGGENRGVVGAEDVDGDRGQRAVGAGHREGVGIGGAGDELEVGRARRGGRGAGGVDREGAVAAYRGGRGDKGGWGVYVADGQPAGRRDVGRRVGLGQVAGVGGEDRGVVGAEDVDGDRGQRAVGAGHREGVGIGGAGDEL